VDAGRRAGIRQIIVDPGIGFGKTGRDNLRLLDTLKTLRDLGNTVIVVEHDAETIRAADHVIDMGPGAGEQGGQIVFSGTPRDLLDFPDSATGNYLSGRQRIEIPPRRRERSHGRIE